MYYKYVNMSVCRSADADRPAARDARAIRSEQPLPVPTDRSLGMARGQDCYLDPVGARREPPAHAKAAQL